jgi:hypothetical protein
MALKLMRSLLAGLGLLGSAPCLDERKRQIAEAQAKGGCVEASYCDTGTLKATFPRVCYPSPAEREAVINDFKSAEIEAAVLQNVLDDAQKPDANSPEAQQKATDAAHQLDADHEAFRQTYAAHVAEVTAADARRTALQRELALAKQDRDDLVALQRNVGIA